jgi:hypothetical protein
MHFLKKSAQKKLVRIYEKYYIIGIPKYNYFYNIFHKFLLKAPKARRINV